MFEDQGDCRGWIFSFKKFILRLDGYLLMREGIDKEEFLVLNSAKFPSLNNT